MDADPGPGPWKNWALKNMDSEKHGINMGLKNMSDFRELRFKNIMSNVIWCLKVHRYLTTLFLYYNSPLKWKLWKVYFSNFMDHKTQNPRFYSSNIACQQYWSGEKNCIAVVWRCPVKKVSLKRLQNSLKNIRDAVFNLIKFHANGLQLYWKETPAMWFPKNFADVLKTPIL